MRSLLLVIAILTLAGCEVLRHNDEWSTLPATNNPNIIIDANRGSGAGSSEY